MIGLIAALREEMVGVLGAWPHSPVEAPGETVAFRGTIGAGATEESMLVLSGVGESRAEAAATWMIRDYAPRAMVILGFAGGARETLMAGHLVIATRVHQLDGTPFEWSVSRLGDGLAPDPELLAMARSAVEIGGIDFQQGPIISLPVIAKTAGLKQWLGTTCGGAAIDMESYKIAEASARAGVPFVCVRAIVDHVDVELLGLISEMDGAPDGSRLFSAVRYAMRRPWDAPGLARLGTAAKQANRSLKDFVEAFAGQVAGPERTARGAVMS